MSIHLFFIALQGSVLRPALTPFVFAISPSHAAFPAQIGKECSTCVQADPVIKKGDILLSSAPLGTRFHYACARKRRKDFLRVVFDTQDKRHANFLRKESAQAEKKTKVEEAVSFAPLAEDSDDELDF